MAGHPVLDCVDCEFGREDGLQICECAGRDSLGNDAAGLDYLIGKRTQYYDRRQQERTLKKGDRVAIPGRGIAVVEQIDGKWIQAAVLGKIALRIARKEIVWDDGNMRWETKVLAPNGV